MSIGVGQGIGALLARLIKKPEGAEGAHPNKPQNDKLPDDPQKEVLLNDLVTAGQGYSRVDKPAPFKNAAEQKAVERFLTDPKLDKLLDRHKKDDEQASEFGSHSEDHAESKKNADEASPPSSQDAREQKDATKQELRRDDRTEEMKDPKPKADVEPMAHEERHHDKEHKRNEDKEEGGDEHRDRDDERDDESGTSAFEDDDMPNTHAKGRATAQPVALDDESPKAGPYTADVLGDPSRCRGADADGARCLRKPVHGTNYCREHVIGSAALGSPRPVSPK